MAELSQSDKIALVLGLLKHLQPYLVEDAPKHPSVLEIYKQNQEGAENHGETAETLNQILDNLNV